jgi:hypothetical protein
VAQQPLLPSPIQAGEAEVAQICKEIFALQSQDALTSYREGLLAQREAGTLKLTKDQGQRIRQTLDAKGKALAATSPVAAADTSTPAAAVS